MGHTIQTPPITGLKREYELGYKVIAVTRANGFLSLTNSSSHRDKHTGQELDDSVTKENPFEFL